MMNTLFHYHENKSQKQVYAMAFFLVTVIFSMDLNIPLGVAGGVPYVAVVLLAQWTGDQKSIVYAALLSTLLTILGFFLSPPGGELWKVLSNRALALFAIWVAAVLLTQRKAVEEKKEKVIREREEALAQIKILRGFLPICASCKKIRDDKGYWNQIESYIRKHSEAQFSHSICPECAAKLYPELDLNSLK